MVIYASCLYVITYTVLLINAACIKKSKIIFTPDKKLKGMLDNLKNHSVFLPAYRKKLRTLPQKVAVSKEQMLPKQTQLDEYQKHGFHLLTGFVHKTTKD